jgi:hypothetical protein
MKNAKNLPHLFLPKLRVFQSTGYLLFVCRRRIQTAENSFYYWYAKSSRSIPNIKFSWDFQGLHYINHASAYIVTHIFECNL